MIDYSKYYLKSRGGVILGIAKVNEKGVLRYGEIVDLLNKISEENEQLRQELQGMNELLKSYRKTIKHDAELLADATRNGYLPPLDDFKKVISDD